MPYTQPWIDPNTGATFPQSYVHIMGQPNVDFNSARVSLQIGRWASQTTYSSGYHALEMRDVQVQGATYASWFAGQVGSALTAFQAGVLVTADTYIGSVPTLSGAAVAP